MTQIPNTAVVETVRFRLKPGVSDADFIALSQASAGFIAACDGFIERRLSKADDGTWTDCALWRDMHSAQAAASQFPAQGFAAQLMGAMHEGSETMTHAALMWHM